MRFQMTAIAAILTRHQKIYVQRVSPITINESSSDPASPNNNSGTDQDKVTQDAFQRSLKTIIKSRKKTD